MGFLVSVSPRQEIYRQAETIATYIYVSGVIFTNTMESGLYSQPLPRYTDTVMREVPWTEGDVVRKLRAVAGWKLKDLVERSGVSLTMIHDLEMGNTKEAKRATLTKIAKAFGLSFQDLLDLVPPKPIRLDVPTPAVRPVGGKRDLPTQTTKRRLAG